MTPRRSERELERILERLEAAEGEAPPSVVVAEREPHGERSYTADGGPVGEQAAAEADVIIGLGAAVAHTVDEQSLEVVAAHPVDPTTGETVEAIELDPDTHEFRGVRGDAEAVVREHPALFDDPDAADDGSG